MPMIDLIQKFRGKLKHPQIRTWVHPRKGGDDYYYPAKGTKGRLYVASKMSARRDKEGYHEKPLVAYKGKEYRVATFLKKYPKYKLKSKIVKKKIDLMIKKAKKRKK